MTDHEPPEGRSTRRAQTRNTSKATEASRATFARRRAEKALAELKAQGYFVVSPDDVEYVRRHTDCLDEVAMLVVNRRIDHIESQRTDVFVA